MRKSGVLVSLLAAIAQGCGGSESPPDTGFVDAALGRDATATTDATAADAAVTSDAGAGADAGVTPGDLVVTISSPIATAYVKDSVTIQVAIAGGTADEVRLLRDGMPLATITAPYQYAWDVRAVAEASYRITASATKGMRTFTSAEVSVVVDRTAPSVMALSPMPGATGVSSTATISATFSEPVLPSSITAASAMLTAGAAPVTYTSRLDAAGTTLTLIPTGAYPRPAMLMVRLSAEITDRAGNALVPPGAPWSWTVPDWFVSELPSLLTTTLPTLGLRAAAAPDGIVIAVSRTLDSGQVEVKVHRFSTGTFTQLGDPLGVMGYTPRLFIPGLVVTAAGTFVAINARLDAMPTEVTGYVYRLDGASWTPLPPRQGNGMRSLVRLVADEGGGPGLVHGTSNGGVSFEHLVNGQWAEWLPAITPPMGEGVDAGSLSLVRNGAGTWFVVAIHTTAGDRRAACWRLMNGAWTEVDAPSAPAGLLPSSFIAAAPHGATGVMAAYANGVMQQAYSVWDGATWAPVGAPSTMSMPNAPFLESMRTDAMGRAVIALRSAEDVGPRHLLLLTREGNDWVGSRPGVEVPRNVGDSVGAWLPVLRANGTRWLVWTEIGPSSGTTAGRVFVAREN